MRREFRLDDSKIIIVLVLFILIPAIYDLFSETGLELFLKLGVVLSGICFLFITRLRDFFFLAMIFVYLVSFVSRRFLS